MIILTFLMRRLEAQHALSNSCWVAEGTPALVLGFKPKLAVTAFSVGAQESRFLTSSQGIHIYTKVTYFYFKESFLSEPLVSFWIQKQLIHLLHNGPERTSGLLEVIRIKMLIRDSCCRQVIKSEKQTSLTTHEPHCVPPSSILSLLSNTFFRIQLLKY